MSILGEKGFDCFVGLEEEGGRRLVLVLELVFLVISTAYICLYVFFNLRYRRREREPEIKEQDIDISFIDLSRIFTVRLLISYSSIHPFFSYFFFLLPRYI